MGCLILFQGMCCSKSMGHSVKAERLNVGGTSEQIPAAVLLVACLRRSEAKQIIRDVVR
jgi:hypothetical protein